ncbi:MAG: DUF4058 family protein [Chloroflexi bacterium]|nr:DUF4058 family protein [Chloroflexota bacterium]
MGTPFPGMDPYLERPALWPDVHNSLIVALRDELQPLLRPRYYASIEERTYTVEPGELVLVGRADVVVAQRTQTPPAAHAQVASESGAVTVELDLPDQIRETYLEVRAIGTDQVVTLIEILSPTNKRPGEGREQYLRKRRAVLASLTHLVEIDLLRGGEPMPLRRGPEPSDYRILVSRADWRPQAELLPCSVRKPLPHLRIPLHPGDPEPELDLNTILHALYERAGYDLRIDYRAPAEPPLEGDDARWADELLRAAGVR